MTKLTINAGGSGAPQILYAGILDSEGTNFNIYDNNGSGADNDGFSLTPRQAQPPRA